MPKKLVIALAFVLISLFFPRVSFAADLTQQEVMSKACVAKDSSITDFQANPGEDKATVTTVCDATRIDASFPAGWKSQAFFIASYCYSGWCKFPGQDSAVRYTTYKDPDLQTYVEGNKEAGKSVNNQQLVKNVMSGVAGWIVCSTTSPTTRCIDEGNDSANSSLTGTLATLIGGMYKTPAADTNSYVADVMRSANIASPAYAQGLGFSALTPILGAWKVFRNIAYLFFIVVVLVIGFMIMFRQKISGQTVVTAQQALPNIVISLIFVTFSYAIAGLLIDAMYLVMYLLVAIFGHVNVQDKFVSTDILSLGATLIVGSNTLQSAGSAIDEVVRSTIANSAVEALSPLAGIAAMVIFGIAMVIGVFRLFFELLKTYVNIIMSIVLSPILLMLGALPGRNVFRDWIQDLIGNLSAFPTVLLVLIIYDEITKGLTGSGVTPYQEGGFMPPYLLGYASGSANGIFKFIIGLGMLLAITEIVKQVKKVMGAKESFGWFASGLQDAIKRGWNGGELIPGVAATNTSKYKITGKGLTTLPFRAGGSFLSNAYNKRQQARNAAPQTVQTESTNVRSNVSADTAPSYMKPPKKNPNS